MSSGSAFWNSILKITKSFIISAYYKGYYKILAICGFQDTCRVIVDTASLLPLGALKISNA